MHKRRTREAESTDASIRRGLPHSSDDAGVMLAERRGQVTGVGMEPTCKGRSPNTQWKTAVFARWHEPDEARVSRPESVSGSGGSSPGRLGGGVARTARAWTGPAAVRQRRAKRSRSPLRGAHSLDCSTSCANWHAVVLSCTVCQVSDLFVLFRLPTAPHLAAFTLPQGGRGSAPRRSCAALR